MLREPHRAADSRAQAQRGQRPQLDVENDGLCSRTARRPNVRHSIQRLRQSNSYHTSHTQHSHTVHELQRSSMSVVAAVLRVVLSAVLCCAAANVFKAKWDEVRESNKKLL